MQQVLKKIRSALKTTTANIPLPFGPALDTKVSSFLSDPQQKLLLMHGEAFCGKTAYCQHLRQTYANQASFIPVYLDLSTLQDPLHQLISQGLASLGLSSEEINAISENRNLPFLFLIDNCDERTLHYNLHATNRLGDWINSKVILITRTIYFLPQENDRIYYVPFQGERACPQTLAEVTIPAITKTETENLESDPILTIALENRPDLKSLITAHRFFLQQYQQQYAKNPSFDEAQWMQYLLNAWFTQEAHRIYTRQQVGTFSNPHTLTVEEIQQACWQMSCELAQQMNQTLNKTLRYAASLQFIEVVEEKTHYWENFFNFKKHPLVAYTLASYMLRQQPLIKYVLLNQALLEYFVTQSGKKILPIHCITSMNEIGQFITKNTQKLLLANSLEIRFNKALFVSQTDQVQLLVESILREDHDSEMIRDELFQLVYASRDKSFEIAATNAITVLNYARVNFSGKDLNGIHIANTVLHGGWFEKVNFSGAVMKNVLFHNVWLVGADFSDANLLNCEFDMDKTIENVDNSSLIDFSFSSDGTQIGLLYDNLVIIKDISTLLVMHSLTHKLSHFCSESKIINIEDVWFIADFDWNNNIITTTIYIQMYKKFVMHQILQSYSCINEYKKTSNTIDFCSDFSADQKTLVTVLIIGEYIQLDIWRWLEGKFKKYKYSEHLRISESYISKNKYFNDFKEISIKFYANKVVLVAMPIPETKRSWLHNVFFMLEPELSYLICYVAELIDKDYKYFISLDREGMNLSYMSAYGKVELCLTQTQTITFKLGSKYVQINEGSILPGTIYTLDISLNQRYLVSNPQIGQKLFIYDLDSGCLLREIDTKTTSRPKIKISPSANFLVSNNDSEIKLYKIIPEVLLHKNSFEKPSYSALANENKHIIYFKEKIVDRTYLYDIVVYSTSMWRVVYQNQNLLYAEINQHNDSILEIMQYENGKRVCVRKLSDTNKLLFNEILSGHYQANGFGIIASFAQSNHSILFFKGYYDPNPKYSSLEYTIDLRNKKVENMKFKSKNSTEQLSTTFFNPDEKVLLFKHKGKWLLFDFHGNIVFEYLIEKKIHRYCLNARIGVIVVKVSDYENTKEPLEGYYTNFGILVLKIDYKKRLICEDWSLSLANLKRASYRNLDVRQNFFISRTGNHLIYINNRINIYSIVDKKILSQSKTEFNDYVSSIAFSVDEKYFALLSGSTTILIFSLIYCDLLQKIPLIKVISEDQYSIAFNEKNALIVIDNFGRINSWKFIGDNNPTWLLEYASSTCNETNLTEIVGLDKKEEVVELQYQSSHKH